MQLFTVDQANRTLPLVRRIVEDVVRAHCRWSESVVELDVLMSAWSDGPPAAQLAALEKQILSLSREADGCQREIEALGIQLKDRRIGLVDFPSEMDGRPVLLCWQLGEPSVQFWHDEQSGFSGRQPLSPILVG